jgi:1-acyl-sn-glycerol-3-phosphate acyltransferase
MVHGDARTRSRLWYVEGAMADESPTPELTPIERVAVAMGRFMNERPWPKRAQDIFLHGITKRWVRPVISSRVYVDGIDWLLEASPDRGVLLAANHRSFFDLYVIMLSLYDAGATWLERMYFPVRANFFYEHPLGVAINFLVGGGVMYPPIFREQSKKAINRDSVERIIRFLGEPGTVVGMHPEGTRGKGPDPYELLPAHPGVGQFVLQARPIAVPVFVNGLPNDILRGLADTYRKNARRDHPIIISFGQPFDYEEMATQKPRATLYKRCADLMLQEVRALGERERELRAACARGEIPDDDPGWLVNRKPASRR